jgi:dTDP-4-dehydrorhamnose 3,5-epimerase
MELEELGIKGAWLARSPIHKDERGFFREWFKSSDLETVINRNFKVAQANISISNKGVIRGIHFSAAKGGQGKWITCAAGAIWDVVVDIRPDSPTFKKWVGTELRPDKGEAIFISEGLGHGFVALEESSIITYLLTSEYSEQFEFGVHPYDSELGINWPVKDPFLSAKDANSPTLNELLRDDKLWKS